MRGLSDAHSVGSDIIAEIDELKSCESCRKQMSTSRRSCKSRRWLGGEVSGVLLRIVLASSGAAPDREKINTKVI